MDFWEIAKFVGIALFAIVVLALLFSGDGGGSSGSPSTGGRSEHRTRG